MFSSIYAPAHVSRGYAGGTALPAAVRGSGWPAWRVQAADRRRVARDLSGMARRDGIDVSVPPNRSSRKSLTYWWWWWILVVVVKCYGRKS
jgi:hypothetical protein